MNPIDGKTFKAQKRAVSTMRYDHLTVWVREQPRLAVKIQEMLVERVETDLLVALIRHPHLNESVRDKLIAKNRSVILLHLMYRSLDDELFEAIIRKGNNHLLNETAKKKDLTREQVETLFNVKTWEVINNLIRGRHLSDEQIEKVKEIASPNPSMLGWLVSYLLTYPVDEEEFREVFSKTPQHDTLYGMLPCPESMFDEALEKGDISTLASMARNKNIKPRHIDALLEINHEDINVGLIMTHFDSNFEKLKDLILTPERKLETYGVVNAFRVAMEHFDEVNVGQLRTLLEKASMLVNQQLPHGHPNPLKSLLREPKLPEILLAEAREGKYGKHVKPYVYLSPNLTGEEMLTVAKTGTFEERRNLISNSALTVEAYWELIKDENLWKEAASTLISRRREDPRFKLDKEHFSLKFIHEMQAFALKKTKEEFYETLTELDEEFKESFLCSWQGSWNSLIEAEKQLR